MRLKRILFILTVLSAASTMVLSQSQKLKLHVKILQVPPIQTVTKSVPSTQAKEGEVVAVSGLRTGGPVTQDFPDGMFMFETEINQSGEDLVQLINEKASTVFPVPVNILPVAEISFLIDHETFETSLFQEKIHPLPLFEEKLSIDYKLQVQAFPFSLKDGEVAVKSTFSAKYKINEGRRKLLFDQIVGIKSNRMLVVGFPSNDEYRRGTIYWLAFYLEKIREQ